MVLLSKRTCIEQDHETPDESAGRPAHAPFENQAMVAASTDDAFASGEAAMPDRMRWHEILYQT